MKTFKGTLLSILVVGLLIFAGSRLGYSAANSATLILSNGHEVTITEGRDNVGVVIIGTIKVADTTYDYFQIQDNPSIYGGINF